MKRIAIASFAISIISLIMVLFLYMPKFKSQPSFQTSDVYLQKIIELYPELQDAVFIDSATSNLYLKYFCCSISFHSILYNIPIVGTSFLEKEELSYQFYNLNTESYFDFIFKKIDKSNEYKLSKISSHKISRANLNKNILDKDTLIELFDKDGNFYYTLKKDDGHITRFIKSDKNSGDGTLNGIWIASSDQSNDFFSVSIATEFFKNLKFYPPAFEGKTIELRIHYKNQDYKTTAIISDGKDVPQHCRPESYNPNNCYFELTAPFENCNLKISVQYDTFKRMRPFINIENEITSLMKCLNVW